jgi:hypothetical protein
VIWHTDASKASSQGPLGQPIWQANRQTGNQRVTWKARGGAMALGLHVSAFSARVLCLSSFPTPSINSNVPTSSMQVYKHLSICTNITLSGFLQENLPLSNSVNHVQPRRTSVGVKLNLAWRCPWWSRSTRGLPPRRLAFSHLVHRSMQSLLQPRHLSIWRKMQILPRPDRSTPANRTKRAASRRVIADHDRSKHGQA